MTRPFVDLPVVLGRSRIRLWPTRQGLLFTLVLEGMLIGSINYNNNLGFLLTFLLGGMALVAALHTWRNLFGLEVTALTCRPVFAGQPLVYALMARPRRLARAALTFQFQEGSATMVDLPKDAAKPIPLTVETRQRGPRDPGALLIETIYPLGWFKAQARIRLDATVVVYPRPLAASINALTASQNLSAESMGGRPEPGADDFDELKRYQPGDTLQRLFWKGLARGQGLLTKTYRTRKGAGILIDHAAVGEADLEIRLSRLCGMVLAAEKMGLDYTLALPGMRIGPGSGENHKRRALTALALWEEEV